jgi:hypothetical protein
MDGSASRVRTANVREAMFHGGSAALVAEFRAIFPRSDRTVADRTVVCI